MAPRAGKTAIYEQLAADGVEYIFGNPGTVEQGLLDAGSQSSTRYLLTLHEGAAVGIADGYARAGQRPAVVQLHSGVGLGNGIGLLYQAKRGGSPLVVLVGEAGVRYDAMDSQMAADLVGMARPVTKYATRVIDPSSTLRVLRRAVKIAMTPPRGPVMVVLPADVLDGLTDEPAVSTTVPHTRVLPEPSLVADAAARLLAGRNPLVLMGDGVATSGAQRELVDVAELLGARVWGVNDSEVNMDTTHRLYGGQLGHMFGADSARQVAEADAVLVVGTYLFPEVFPHLDNPFRDDAQIVHIDLDSFEIAKNFPVDVGIVADPRFTLAALARELRRQGAQPAATGHDAAGHGATGQGAAGQAPASTPDGDGSVPDMFVRTLAARAPENLAVFDEALTASPTLTRHLPARVPGQYFQTRGGSLGVGIPGAIGVKLARPDLDVIGFTGDGGSMYTIQSLWTAARYGVDAKFVICNNRRYRLLDLNIEQYWREQGIEPHQFPEAFDLSRPDMAFSEIAMALGVPGRRVERAHEIEGAVDALLHHPGPYLIDLITG